jgi:hypothetical protein
MRLLARPIRELPGAGAGTRSARVGFTLAELVLAAVIIGPLPPIAIPRFRDSLAQRRADAASRGIVAHLTPAHTRPIGASAGQMATLEVAAASNLLVAPRHLDRPARKYAGSLSDDPYGAAIVTIDLGAAVPRKVVSDAYGVPDSGGTIVVEAGGNQKTMTVDPDTGRASVQ